MRLSVKSIVVCHEYQVSVWRVRVLWLLKHVCSRPAGHSPFLFSDCALASSMSCCCAALNVCRTHAVSDLCCTICSAAFVGRGSHHSPTLSCNCHYGSVHGRAQSGPAYCSRCNKLPGPVVFKCLNCDWSYTAYLFSYPRCPELPSTVLPACAWLPL